MPSILPVKLTCRHQQRRSRGSTFRNNTKTEAWAGDRMGRRPRHRSGALPFDGMLGFDRLQTLPDAREAS